MPRRPPLGRRGVGWREARAGRRQEACLPHFGVHAQREPHARRHHGTAVWREAPRAARPLHVVAVALAEGVCRSGGQRRVGSEQLRQRLRQQAARAVTRRAARDAARVVE